MKNKKYCVIWILIVEDCNCNNSFNFWNFPIKLDGIESKLVKLHFFSFNQIPKLDVFKVTISCDDGMM